MAERKVADLAEPLVATKVERSVEPSAVNLVGRSAGQMVA